MKRASKPDDPIRHVSPAGRIKFICRLRDYGINQGGHAVVTDDAAVSSADYLYSADHDGIAEFDLSITYRLNSLRFSFHAIAASAMACLCEINE
jgi:hypothetical protein